MHPATIFTVSYLASKGATGQVEAEEETKYSQELFQRSQERVEAFPGEPNFSQEHSRPFLGHSTTFLGTHDRPWEAKRSHE